MAFLNLKKISLGLFLVLSFVSCSHFDPANPHHDVVKEEGLKPGHGGKLVEGHDYILEIVSSEDKIAIYPMKFSEKREKLLSLPLNKVDMDVRYSYIDHEKGEGTKGRPTQKMEVSVPLVAKGEAFVGKVKAKHTNGYLLIIKMNYKGEKEKYRHEVQF